MKTIHLDRLDLKCRGLPPATAQAALSELGPALARELQAGSGTAPGPLDQRGRDGALRVRAGVTAATLAGAVAARVAAQVHAHAGTTKFRKPS